MDNEKVFVVTDKTTVQELIDNVYTLRCGDVFKWDADTMQYETLLGILARITPLTQTIPVTGKPNPYPVEEFTVAYCNPGSYLYMTYGDNTLVVTSRKGFLPIDMYTFTPGNSWNLSGNLWTHTPPAPTTQRFDVFRPGIYRITITFSGITDGSCSVACTSNADPFSNLIYPITADGPSGNGTYQAAAQVDAPSIIYVSPTGNFSGSYSDLLIEFYEP